MPARNLSKANKMQVKFKVGLSTSSSIAFSYVYVMGCDTHEWYENAIRPCVHGQQDLPWGNLLL